jgi:hypothetical protein
MERTVASRPLWKTICVIAVIAIAIIWNVLNVNHSNKIKVKVNYLQITNTNSPDGKGLLPEQRRKFALEFERKLKDKGMDATATTTGDFHTTIMIQGNVVNGPLVSEMLHDNAMIQDLRGMGFKHLYMTDGSAAWDVDLKN